MNPAGVGSSNYWEYTLRGGAPESWEPQFNYSGFQYIQDEGAVPDRHANPNNLPVVEELVSVHVRGSVATVGRFESSNPLFNAIDRNIDWAVRSNLSHVLTDLRTRKNQQTAGDVGFPYLIEALGKFGRHDVLYDISTRTEMGSYGFIINNGWTAMPEAWDANTGASMNHCMLGHIQQWFLGSLAGIRPEPLAPGFARFTISPEPVGNLKEANGEYLAVRGRIASSWKLDGGQFQLAVTVPPNTIAEVFLPTPKPEDVLEPENPPPRRSA